jgi:hypothetical protein
MDFEAAGAKRKMQMSELEEWREGVSQCQDLQGKNQEMA